MVFCRRYLLILCCLVGVYVSVVPLAFATTIFQDDFDTGFSSLETHTPNTGTSWSKVIDNSMGLTVQSYNQYVNVVSNGSSVGSLYTASSTYSTADYEILAHINFAGATDSNYGRWLAVRVQDASNMYALRVGGTMKIYKRVSGTWTELTSTTTVPTIQNLTSPYRADWFSLRASGTTISATINGTEVLSVTDASISTAGKAGIGLGRVNTGVTDNAGTGVGLDNVLVRTLEADTVVAPTTQATSVATSSVTQTAATVSWTNGNGSRRVVFIKAASSGTAVPDNNRAYTAIRTSPTGGSQIGSSGWYTVYDGTGTNVALTGLTSNTAYIVHVLEYNGDQGFEKYLADAAIDNPKTFTTLPYETPTVAASGVSMATISGKISNVSWTSGNGANRIVFVKEGTTSGEAAPVDGTSYTANAAFGSGTQISSTGWYAVYSGTGSNVNVSGLDSTKSYRVHVVEYNGTSGVQKYLTAAGTNNPANKSAYAGATLYSNYTSGNDTTGTGSSGNPYKTFHKAYSMAVDGDTLDLTGTFSWTNADETGDATTNGYTISKNNLTLHGAGAGTTTIEAHTVDNTADRRVFLVNSNVTLIMENMTVRYGKTSTGACVYVNTSANVTIRGASFVNCRASSQGGGIYMTGATVVLEKSSFSGGTSSLGGGGIYVAGTSPSLTLTNTTLSGNTSGSSYYGAGIYVSTSGVTPVRLTNVTITGNTGSARGAGIGISGSSITTYLKNTIVAGNTATTMSDADLYRASGAFTSGGYNIVGRFTSSYMATSTADWDDVGGDGTYFLYGGGTGTLSLGATTTAANGTIYAPLQTGSIGIDHGTTTAHGSVVIPTTDQLAFGRSGATDIGAYEYGGTNDSTVPTVSLTLPDDGATIYGSTVGINATASDDTAVAGVRFYVNNTPVGSEDTSSPYSVTWNSLSATTSGSKIIVAVARDSSNNYATSTARTVTLTNQPSPSSLTYTGATTTATVQWSTPVEGSSRMFFGFTNALASSTPEQNTSSRVTSHSINVSNLPPCTVFKYQTVSKNELSEVATSSQSTFKTAGCSGSASILANNEDDITVTSGGTLTQDVLSLTIPASFTSTSSQATFQAKKLDGSTFFSSIAGPSGKSRATTTVYNLSAYTDTSTTLSTFSAPLTVTFSYTDGDVAGLNESSLKIYRYDSSAWSALSSCSVNTSANTVSCTTTQFSDFGIFGDVSSSSTGASSSSGGGVITGCTDRNALNYSKYAYGVDLASCQYSISFPRSANASSTIARFDRNLSQGMSGEDVVALQVLLITKGFTIYAGATGYFGSQTRDSLIAFQKANNISPATGYFGSKTRSVLDSASIITEGDTSSTVLKSPVRFSRDLKRGDTGDDVQLLQEFLIRRNTGPVARMLESATARGFFGTFTKSALIEFQQSNGISPAIGYFGPKTRSFIETFSNSN